MRARDAGRLAGVDRDLVMGFDEFRW